uniref:Uncharacterized protein n=1 Tax=Anguilla anguilla TaxID=7936 RepID=A0A0E9UAG0_ANGAN
MHQITSLHSIAAFGGRRCPSSQKLEVKT